MELLVQPDDGIKPILRALRRATKSIQILIFRHDRSDVERALIEAVQRGVAVHALIAFTNRGEEKNLRMLEMRLLEHGVTVTRTANDLVRYHGKMFVIDQKELHLLAFNYTDVDITLSRSFAAVISEPALVTEAVKLFECDVHRVPFRSSEPELVVSPVNARTALMNFIGGAKKQLLLYEMKISDPDFIELLQAKIADGVDVRILGRSAQKVSGLPLRVMSMRLHARAIVRDGISAFLGSQSLRRLELEARREIGVIFHDKTAVKRMMEIFEHDWRSAQSLQASSFESATEISSQWSPRLVAMSMM